MGSGSHRSGESWLARRLREVLRGFAVSVQPEADALDKITGKIEYITRTVRAHARFTEHMPTKKCSPVHCYGHGVDELSEPGDYHACFECQHIFRTSGELLSAHNALMANMGLLAAAELDEVTACPFCYHDF